LKSFHIFSAGAAQAVVERLLQQSEPAGDTPEVRYGAVHTMLSCILANEPADVVILTKQLIDELIDKDQVVRGSRVDLGSVGTGVAVRNGVSLPDVSSVAALRLTLLSASRIWCPAPSIATAGKVLMQALAHMDIAAQVQPSLVYCSSGFETLKKVQAGVGANEIGVMQMTEIIAGIGLDRAQALPRELQVETVYSAGLVQRSGSPDRARKFLKQIDEARTALRSAGFGDGELQLSQIAGVE